MYGFQLLLEQYSLPVYQIGSMIVTASVFVSAWFVPWKITKAGRCWWQKVPQMFHVIRSYFWCSENVLLLKGILINGTTSEETTCTAPFSSEVSEVLEFWKFVTKLSVEWSVLSSAPASWKERLGLVVYIVRQSRSKITVSTPWTWAG